MAIRGRWILAAVTAIGLAISASGCGLEKAADLTTNVLIAGSCTMVTTVATVSTTLCIDYTGSGFTGVSAQSACDSLNSTANGATVTGTYSTAQCSATGRVGSCKVQSGQATELTYRYKDGYTDSTAHISCDSLTGIYTSG